MRFFIYVIIFLVVASCSNTSIYNRTVTQGTVFKQDDIDRLEIGMSKDQVSFIMGQPSFQNIFDENVWDLHPTNAEIPVPPSRSKKSSAMYFIISKGFSRLPTLKSFKTLNPDTLMRHRIIQIAITINVARVLVVGIRS